jgi:hypothetical protein
MMPSFIILPDRKIAPRFRLGTSGGSSSPLWGRLLFLANPQLNICWRFAHSLVRPPSEIYHLAVRRRYPSLLISVSPVNPAALCAISGDPGRLVLVPRHVR